MELFYLTKLFYSCSFFDLCLSFVFCLPSLQQSFDSMSTIAPFYVYQKQKLYSWMRVAINWIKTEWRRQIVVSQASANWKCATALRIKFTFQHINILLLLLLLLLFGLYWLSQTLHVVHLYYNVSNFVSNSFSHASINLLICIALILLISLFKTNCFYSGYNLCYDHTID